MLRHSFLIMYSENKKKWCVECSLLKIMLHADTYREALFLTAKAMLEYNLSKEFSDLIEQDKQNYMRD